MTRAIQTVATALASTSVDLDNLALPGLLMTGFINALAANSIVAFPTGGQSNGTALTGQVSRVVTVATRLDSVKLPVSVAGLAITVINAGANAVAVFPQTGDAINVQAANLSVLQAPGSIAVYACPLAGFWYATAAGGYTGSLATQLAEDTITAFAGGGQGSARLLTSQVSRVSVVATAGDSIKLPVSSPGLEIVVIHHGATPMGVFGSGSDTINDLAGGITQMAGSTMIYTCATAGAWYTLAMGVGYSGSLQTQSSTNGITAFATGGQGSAVLLTTQINRVTTVATAADSVKLPVSVAGMNITLINAAANSLNLFPNTGEVINALAANAAFAVAANKTVKLFCAVAGTWNSILTA